MNAHERIAAKMVERLTAADISDMVPDVAPEIDLREQAPAAEDAPERKDKLGRPIRPRKRKAAPKVAGMGLAEVQAIVVEHATDDTRLAWATLLTEAMDEPRGDRPSTWWGPLVEMVLELEALEVPADDADVAEPAHLREVA